ncbi:MAG: transcription antitermination factor NusB [Gammaproteobacteria bacterium]|nr:transcription antitermination factor NusB [Gammaproteobacteria bacterium]MDE2345178.1 transcription antitermination factor NusB [Gammaproteobacteria bacterium]
MASSSRHGARARSRARRLALQGLYQWQLSAAQPDDIIGQFRAAQGTRDTDMEYFEELVRGVITNADRLSAAFSPHLDRPLMQLDPVERAICLLAAYELSERVDVPYRVVLNEAVELAKKFGAEDSHKHINAVLDRTAAGLRATEHPQGTAGV